MISSIETTIKGIGRETNWPKPDQGGIKPLPKPIKFGITPKPEKKESWLETLLKPIISFIYGLYDFLSGLSKMLELFFGKGAK